MKVDLTDVSTVAESNGGTFEQRVTIEPVDDGDSVLISLPSMDSWDHDLSIAIGTKELGRAIGYCKDEAKAGG